MDCEDSEDCLADGGYCHPKTKICLCQNGLSTYPACNRDKGNGCSPACKPREFCDLKDEKCMCSLGGFPPNCNTKKCPPFQVEDKGSCVCMFGKFKGICQKCRQDCGKYGICEKQGKQKVLIIR